MSSAQVRLFREADRIRLRDIYRASRRHAFHWIAPERFALGDFDRDTRGERIWVAELDGSAVGFASVWEPDNFVHCLFVDPISLGAGVGRELLRACAARALAPLTLKCQQRNAPAIRFYKANGWRITGSGAGVDGAYYLMRLEPAVAELA